jgi:predicted phage terminase large subunit-like protein
MTNEEILTPALFAQSASRGQWLPAKHLRLLSDKLVDVATGETRHLMVFMPPRHGKSMLTSQYFPAWFLCRYPDKRVLLTSYEADFAATWGYRARNVLLEHGHLFGVKVSPMSSARNRWDIEGHSGGMSTAGVGGAITGKGAHLLIIDDPVKNDEQANSKTYRDRTAEWYKSTAYTRLEPGGAVIIIQTRWHEDDLSGRLMKDEPGKWEVINLPALAESNDQLGRMPGEALFPRRYDVDALLDIKQTIGSYWFSSMYQQRPQIEEGSIFKRPYFRYFEATLDGYVLRSGDTSKTVTKSSCKIFQTCDPASSTKDTADYFVLATWAQTPNQDLLLLDVNRTRLEGPEQVKLFKSEFSKWQPSFQAVEAVAAGKLLYQMLVREGLPVRELRPDKDKVSRALPAAARMEAGTIYLKQGAPWLVDYEDELTSFPRGAHDDQVDVTSYAVQMIMHKPYTVPRFAPGFGISGGFGYGLTGTGI